MQSVKPTETFIHKIDALQFLMAVVIVFAHGATFTQAQGNGALNALALHFFENLTAFTGAALSVFMTISAFLLFYNYDPKTYAAKIRRRLVRNLIPYMAWNTLGILYTHPSFHGLGDVVSWYLLSKGCPVFWFLEMVTVLALFAPVNAFLFKNKKVSFLLLALLCLFTVFLCPDFRNVSFLSEEAARYLNRCWSYIYTYAIGIVAARHFRAFILRETYGKRLNLLGWAGIVYLLVAPYNTLYRFVSVHAFLFIWMAADTRRYTQRHWYQTMSFFLYASHPIGLSVLHRILNGLHLGHLVADVPVEGMYALFIRTVLSLSTVFLCLGVGYLLQRYVPFVYAIAVGNRKAKKA